MHQISDNVYYVKYKTHNLHSSNASRALATVTPRVCLLEKPVLQPLRVWFADMAVPVWQASCLLCAPAWLMSGCASPTAEHAGAQLASESTPASAPASAPAWQAVPLPGKRHTLYQPSRKDGRPAWEAISEQSASMWRRPLRVEPQQLGEVAFSWWVSDLLPGADLAVGGQGDSPARVIFAFDGNRSKLSMRNRMLFEMASTLTGEEPPYATLMYVWANEAQPESVVLNPRTDRIRKIVLESGPRHLRQWRDYRRQLAEDYRRAFGEEPGPLIGVAVMTDTDNTLTATRTWYGDVRVGTLALPAQP